MKRRDFVGKTIAAGGIVAPAAAMSSFDMQGRPVPVDEEIVIEKAA